MRRRSARQRLPVIAAALDGGAAHRLTGRPDSALPSYVLGHIGYSSVPWKRGQGYATRALELLLDDARAEGLEHVELTCDASNAASQRVITANGGALVERFVKPPQFGGHESLRFRIRL